MPQAAVLAPETESFVSETAGQYLTFNLGQEYFGLEILKVQEIIGVLKITSMPRTPEYVRGVINLRGKVVPVVDLRKRFEMSTTEDTEKTVIIVVQISHDDAFHTTGLLVDQVNEVLDVDESDIEMPPTMGDAGNIEFIRAMGKVNDNVVMLLDADKILGINELAIIEKSVN